MKLRVKESEQVRAFLGSLALDSRKRLRSAIHEVAAGERPLEPLTRGLDGYHKLKLQPWRMVCRYGETPNGPALFLVFAWTRDEVYELFTQLQAEQIIRSVS
jgi:hypothetical protein